MTKCTVIASGYFAFFAKGSIWQSKLQNSLLYWLACHICKSCHTDHSFCHTERSEVSINLRCLKFFGFFVRFATLKMTRVRRHCKMTKCVFFVRHCEPFSQKRRGNPKIRLEFCPKFKAKIKKGEMLWIQSQILQKGAVKPLHAPPFIGTLFIEIWI